MDNIVRNYHINRSLPVHNINKSEPKHESTQTYIWDDRQQTDIKTRKLIMQNTGQSPLKVTEIKTNCTGPTLLEVPEQVQNLR